MAQIKIVPDSAPDAEGEWITTIPVEFPHSMKWLETEQLVRSHIPAGFHLVAVARDPRETLNSITKLRS